MTKLFAKLHLGHRSIFRKRSKKHTKSIDFEDSSAETVKLGDSQSEQSDSSSATFTQLSLDGSVVSFDSPSSCESVESSDAVPQEDARATLAPSSCESADSSDVVTAAGVTARDHRKRVAFQDVSVRYYDLIIGSRTDVKFPLSLGWNYREQDTNTVKLEEYEDARNRRVQQKLQTRIQPRLYVPPEDTSTSGHYHNDVHTEQDYDDDVSELLQLDLHERRTRLRSFGFSEAELRCAERQRRVALALECSTATPGEVPSGLAHPAFVYSPKLMTRYCF